MKKKRLKRNRMMIPVGLMGLKLYIQSFLTNLIFGYLFRKEIDDSPNKCDICNKPLIKRRYEISIVRPDLDYNFEYCNFLCIDHAIQFLYTYKKRILT